MAWVVMVALVAGLLWVHARPRRARFEWALKPAAALTFVLAGLSAQPWDRPWACAMLVGLCFAAVGDVLLIGRGERTFLAGLVSFLLGHLAYAGAFALRGVALGALAAAAVVLALLTWPILRWLWPHVGPAMRPPVAAYVAVITAMVALAAGTHGAAPDLWLLAGAVGFYLSDLAVARDRFVRAGFVNRAWGLPLYFFSQLALVEALR